MEGDLELLRAQAVEGDRDALEALVAGLVDDVYRISFRMVWDISDAEDATQEILTKVVTGLAGFEGRSALKTWVHRIAVNHLLDRRRLQPEDLTFDTLAADLVDGLEPRQPDDQPELEVLAREVMVTCTGAMLLCLDRPHRVAYVLGDILELPGPLAASVIGVDQATFRKRLQRGRAAIRGFMQEQCGLVAADARCHCTRRVKKALELDRIRLDANEQRLSAETAVVEINALHNVESIMRATADEPAPAAVLDRWRAALEASPTLMENP